MQRTFFIAMSILGIFIIGERVYAIHATLPAETTIIAPYANPDSVYDYIKAKSPYTDWKLWPGKERRSAGSGQHGAHITIYLNDLAAAAVKKGKGMPPESLIVMENFSKEKKLSSISVMYKVMDYNPTAGNWFWAEYSAEGKNMKAGKVQGCIDCHEAKKKNDYVMIEDFVK